MSYWLKKNTLFFRQNGHNLADIDAMIVIPRIDLRGIESDKIA